MTRAERRRRLARRNRALEIACVLLVLAAISALVAWVIVNAGGGHMLT